MARWLLSIVSIMKHPAKTIDTVRAWVQQYEMLKIPRDGKYLSFSSQA